MDPLWFKDAVFYQVHVRSFFDANNDGVGDFPGLSAKLDYVQALGVDTIWLLPFYPSPLRDDGYDIADYRSINPAYGTVRDFRAFVREAHARGIRVVTELVVNHTSDQHPWFQRARAARAGSAARDFYVWSDSDKKYAGTRIIFTDTEKSNWAWDDQAKAFFWHRFFSHQPDLNYANPRVVREVISVMRFWLDMGVDGMRLDAVPYLCEREGTNNENLPETHGILKQLRGALDASHPGRIFLAEANQWPEDVLPYFGDGDECHMAFHFPLMPRMYMAIAREDRHPITDIVRQTPDIPAGCQWAIFLRNHDELTLEMVTDRERDYLWSTYASDRRARINLGIRRRLAPLMENDRRRIELLNAVLFSMPGTPIIYYGDELGMGDNFFLGDRNGVRTPMQWTEDRNGGFSRADPASLFLPPNMDPVYGYQAVNVEAQSANASSLLSWMRRMVAARRARKAFGRGSFRFLYPTNRHVLVYLREHEGETVLCVANLSRSAQGVELDLHQFKGRIPVELTGQSSFPPIGDLPYFLTLPGYGFYWFLLSAEAEPPVWHVQVPGNVPELFTVVVREGLTDVLNGPGRRVTERDVLPAYLQLQRWFAEKDVGLANVEVVRWAELATSKGSWLVSISSVRRADGVARCYHLPLAAWWTEENPSGGRTLARLRRGSQVGLLSDAFHDDDFLRALVEAMREGATLRGTECTVHGHATRTLAQVELPETPEVARIGSEQSNSSAVIGDRVVLKLIRRPVDGANPEVEMGRFLTETSRFANTPPLLGWIEARDQSGREAVLAVMHGAVPNQGPAWDWVVAEFERFLDEASLLPPDKLAERLAGGLLEDMLDFARVVGQRTAEMHRALSRPTGDPNFDPVPALPDDLERWRLRALDQARGALDALEKAGLPGAVEPASLFLAVDRRVPKTPFGTLVRVHGDYHLGQLLVAKEDVHVIDFEGEPGRAPDARRAKDSPLRDVAGLLRSFDYAMWTTLGRIASVRPEVPGQLDAVARDWLERTSAAFLDSYFLAVLEGAGLPLDDPQARGLLDLFVIEKACYEIRYEAANRPAWLGIPLKGLLAMLPRGRSEG